MAKKGCALRILGQLDDATEVLFKLLKFTEVTDSKVILFAIFHGISLGQNHFRIGKTSVNMSNLNKTSVASSNWPNICNAQPFLAKALIRNPY